MNGKSLISVAKATAHSLAANAAFSLLSSEIPGLPQGAITEISGFDGSGKTEAVLRFLAENPSLRVGWVEQDLSVYPCAFPQSGVSLDRVFFVDVAGAGEKLALWGAHQVLTSQVFGAVVLNMPIRDALPLRKLQLAAEKNGVTVILLSERPLSATTGATWPIHLQLEASREPDGSVRLSVRKYRGARTWRPQTA